MSDHLYDANKVSFEEAPFQAYFERLLFEFGDKYGIWVRNEDCSRFISVGVVNQISQIAVTIYLKCSGVAISDPLSVEVIEQIRNHFASDVKEDLRINYPPILV